MTTGNGVPGDNRPENLRWATVAENHADKRSHGTDLVGERNGRAKLSREKIAEARRLIGSGVERQEIARRFGVHRSTLRHALVGNTWRTP